MFHTARPVKSEGHCRQSVSLRQNSRASSATTLWRFCPNTGPSDGATMTMQALNGPGLNAKELHALVAVAHFGSLVNASAFLQTSQSALSRTITRIEKLVGVRLFVRSTRRIELTPAGREFVAVSERVLNDLHIAPGGLRDIPTEQRGQVIVSSF